MISHGIPQGTSDTSHKVARTLNPKPKPIRSVPQFCCGLLQVYSNHVFILQRSELCNVDVNDYDYNKRFVPAELDKVCDHLKLAKVVGPDMIPNEVLKHGGIRNLLLQFLNMCFVNNVIPSIWRKAIIAPIPKSASKDPCVPLNYRGIRLLSCLYKLYTSLLNLRMCNHCEKHGYLVDEQNGFRPDRSCQDHIYVLSSIIRNRKSTGENTYCAFVDFKKAFDWVSRDLLL